MQVLQLEVSKIKPYEKNAKKHDKKQIQAVAKSIKRFGWAQPLVVDKENNLIIGHCRLLAAKTLDLKEVPVVQMDNLTPEEVNALRLADNKLNESVWDMALVVEDLKLLDEELLSLIGFNEEVLSDGLTDGFSLTDEEKTPFQNLTFTLSDDQTTTIKNTLKQIMRMPEFEFMETNGNTNSNGNALALLAQLWQAQN